MNRRDNIANDDNNCAVLVRKRMVNTYSRVCPRQAIEKHHFMTPDTPVVDEIELPSRLLRDNTTATATNITCSTNTNSHSAIKPSTPLLSSTPAALPNSDKIKDSLIMTRKKGKKKNFKSTLETHSRKKKFCDPGVKNDKVFNKTLNSIDKKLGFLKRTLSNELSKIMASDHQQENIDVTMSTPTLSHTPHQLHSITHPTNTDPPANSSHNNTLVSQNATNCSSSGSTDKVSQRAKTLNRTDEVTHNLRAMEGEMKQEYSREGVNVSQTSLEVDSVHLMSCDNNSCHDDGVNSKLNTSSNKHDRKGIKDSNEECKDTASDGDDDMEKVRGVAAGLEEEPFMMITTSPILTSTPAVNNPPTSPFFISPDLPEKCSNKKRKGYSIDLNGLCGLPSSINNNSSTTTERKRNHRTSTVTSQQGLQSTGEVRRKTESSAVPVVAANIDRVHTHRVNSNSPNISDIFPSLIISTEHPLTSTPIHPNHTHFLPEHIHHNTTELIERELREHAHNHHQHPKTCLTIRENVCNNLTSGVGSTMENLMDFDAIPYQASTNLNMSSSTLKTSLPKTISPKHHTAKTLMNRAQCKRNTRLSKRKMIPAKKSTAHHHARPFSGATPRPKCTTTRPSSSTTIRPNRTTVGPCSGATPRPKRTTTGPCSGATPRPKHTTTGPCSGATPRLKRTTVGPSSGTTIRPKRTTTGPSNDAIPRPKHTTTGPSSGTTIRPKCTTNVPKTKTTLQNIGNTISDQTKPKITKNRPIKDQTNQTENHSTTTIHKRPKKRCHKQFIIPFPLRQKRRRIKSQSNTQNSSTNTNNKSQSPSLPQFESNSTSMTIPQCILTQHHLHTTTSRSSQPGNKILVIEPLSIIVSNDTTCYSDDILTEVQSITNTNILRINH